MCNREEAARALLVCLPQARADPQKRVCRESAEVSRGVCLKLSYVTSSFLRKDVSYIRQVHLVAGAIAQLDQSVLDIQSKVLMGDSKACRDRLLTRNLRAH